MSNRNLGEVTKMCHVRVGEVFYKVRSDMSTDDSAQYMLILRNNRGRSFSDVDLSGNLYVDNQHGYTFTLVNIATGLEADLPHLSSRVRVLRGFGLVVWNACELQENLLKAQAAVAELERQRNGYREHVTRLDNELRELRVVAQTAFNIALAHGEF